MITYIVFPLIQVVTVGSATAINDENVTTSCLSTITKINQFKKRVTIFTSNISWKVRCAIYLMANCMLEQCTGMRLTSVIKPISKPYCMMLYKVPYSRKYWRELNLAVEPKIAIGRILADFNLVVQYGIAIRMYASRNFGGF